MDGWIRLDWIGLCFFDCWMQWGGVRKKEREREKEKGKGVCRPSASIHPLPSFHVQMSHHFLVRIGLCIRHT